MSFVITRHKHTLIFLAVCAGAALIMAAYGFEGSLEREDGLFMYMGQQFARGVPPLVSAVDLKTPLPSILIGFAVHASRILGTNDLLTARIFFWLIASLAVGGVYLLAAELFQAKLAGIFASALMLQFAPFAKEAVSGPREKIPMLLFQTFCLWLAARRRWFWAGLFGSLAFLCWQLAAIFPLAVFFLAYWQSDSPAQKRANLLKAFAGFAIPVVLLALYYLWNGALGDLLYFTVIFPFFSDIPRAARGLNFNILEAILQNYRFASWAIMLAFTFAPLFYVWRIKQMGGIKEVLRRDKFAILLITLPFPFVWSWIDFEGAPDFFIFLPYLSVILAWLMLNTLWAMFNLETERRSYRFAGAFVVALFVLSLLYFMSTENLAGLHEQRQWARQVKGYLTAPEDELVVLGRTEILALLHYTNPYKYVAVFEGVIPLIERESGLPIEVWLENELARGPKVIAPSRPLDELFDELIREQGYPYEKILIGEWVIFVRED